MPTTTEAPPESGSSPAAIDGVFVREGAAVTRRIAGETIIVPVRDDVADLDSIYTLNETGSFVWDLLDRQRTVAELVEAVIGEFEVAPEVAAADVARLIVSLRDEGLLRAVHG
jgi:hypothetical protein